MCLSPPFHKRSLQVVCELAFPSWHWGSVFSSAERLQWGHPTASAQSLWREGTGGTTHVPTLKITNLKQSFIVCLCLLKTEFLLWNVFWADLKVWLCFQLIVCGLGKIDIADWKSNTRLKHCTPDTNIVKWFWKAVESFDEERRARLLQFVTGSSRVPLQGFKALQGT